jgi:glucose-6-phosphate isomerase
MAGTTPLRDKLVLVDDGSGLRGFPDWAEQLIAESTGKQGTGVLPVVVGGTGSPEVVAPPADATVVRLVADADEDESEDGPGSAVTVTGALGAQMLLWEAATAAAGRLLGINPFDQPDVESAKKAARALLDSPADPTAADFTDGPVSVRALGGPWLGNAETLRDAVQRLLAHVDPDHGYLAVMAYLDRETHSGLDDVRETLARRLQRPVTFGWGPRFLHSTGQFHKGGPAVGVFLQVTATPTRDLPVPDRDFGFGTLISAQAAGDAQVLADHGRPVLRVHLEDPGPGLVLLREALS